MAYFATMYRTPNGEITTMKARYTSIDDARDQLVDEYPWLADAEDAWVHENEGAHFSLTDGSQFLIYKEAQ